MDIVRAGAERIADLQPLWESLSRHHAEVAPELAVLGEVRAEADSWVVRRELYEEWLQDPDAFVLIAESDGEPVGYAMVQLRGPEETWATGDRVAQLETLTVLPEHRGQPFRGERDRVECRCRALLRAARADHVPHHLRRPGTGRRRSVGSCP